MTKDVEKDIKNVNNAGFDIEYNNEAGIVGLKLIPLSFSALVRVIESASSADDTEFSALIQRKRLVAQLRGVKADGSQTILSEAEVLGLPAPAARAALLRLREGEGEIGEVLGDGDGVTKPVLYRLGTPIKYGTDIIEELEFKASTYGEIEAVLAETAPILQALALITHNAKPIYENGTLQRLPTPEIEQITQADGGAILQHVLPRFL